MRGKPALRGQAKSLQSFFLGTSALGDKLGSLMDLLNQLLLVLELWDLGGNQAQYDGLSWWKVGERLEAACASGVILKVTMNVLSCADTGTREYRAY